MPRAHPTGGQFEQYHPTHLDCFPLHGFVSLSIQAGPTALLQISATNQQLTDERKRQYPHSVQGLTATLAHV